jgi:hypothetical protein
MKRRLRKTIILFLPALFLFYGNNIFAQKKKLTGTVKGYSGSDKSKTEVLPFASVYWIGASSAITTDDKGHFEIKFTEKEKNYLITAFVGYASDTLLVSRETDNIEIILKSNVVLKETEINEKLEGSYISKIDPRKTQIITTNELCKAACCNLAESFETNSSVDVSYSDAITGARQIQMLGLSGVYSQIQAENIPVMRGMASQFGLSYIPGPWMESIQISKGTSSVINGFESITGQINVEYKKPATADMVFVNFFANSNLRLEANALGAWQINKKLSTMLMIHGDDYRYKFDRNGDNFMDLPLLNTVNVFNRWDYINPGKFVSRFGIKYLNENRNGGTMDYDKRTFVDDTAAINKGTEPYGFGLKTQRAEAFWKNGLMFEGKPYQSLALILSGTYHDQNGFFGINDYAGKQVSFYGNLLYSSIIGTTDHKFTTGLSFMYDDYTETYNQKLYVYDYQVSGVTTPEGLFTIHHSVQNDYNWDRIESVAGAFFEYTYNLKDKFTLIAGIRADYDNIYGMFYTPRLNLRYKFNETTILRGSAGMGYRTANIISENLSLLASQRQLITVEPLDQEKAVNFGVNFIKEFKIFKRKAEFDIDVYRTQFLNQVIVDMDSMPTAVYFYNLNGQSYSNSYQAQFSFEPVKRFTALLAFRINDVKTTIDGVLQQRPFVSKYKGLVTLSYATKFEKWKFDFTTQFNGSSRLPNQSKMPEVLRRPENTPEYIILNAQVTKKFRNFDIYLGCENITDFRQLDPITEPSRPYHTHFDTAMTWGPVVGRTFYLGFRYKLGQL